MSKNTDEQLVKSKLFLKLSYTISYGRDKKINNIMK